MLALLRQAYISQHRCTAFTLVSDCNYVAQNGARVARALFEVSRARRNGWAARRLLGVVEDAQSLRSVLALRGARRRSAGRGVPSCPVEKPSSAPPPPARGAAPAAGRRLPSSPFAITGGRCGGALGES